VNGWLVQQLPRCMAEDPLLSGLVAIFEEVTDSLRARIDGVEQCLDVQLAPPEQLRWTGSWLGLVVEPSLPEQRQRAVVGETGRTLGWRGTRRGLERLVGALTGAPTTVSDTGGVYRPGEAPVTAQPPSVVVQVQHAGGIDERKLLAFVAAELPPGAAVDLRIGSMGNTSQTEMRPNDDPMVESSEDNP
jgi:phage tail-like protein